MATDHSAPIQPLMKDRLTAQSWIAVTIIIFLTLHVFTAAVPASTVAAALEGPHVLYLVAKAYGSIAALQVNQKLIAYPQIPEAFPEVFDETAIYVMPDRFRADLVTETRQHIYLEVGDRSLTLMDGRLVEEPLPFLNYQRVLRSRTQPQLMRTLNQMGVETAISSLGRVAETVVYVLGARYPDESVTQLAIDKQTFLPLRLLLVGGEPGTGNRRQEIFFYNWQKVQSGWFPFQIVFFLNGRLVREIRVANLRLNPSIPADVLDLEALKASAALKPGDPAAQGVENVQQKVE